MDTATATLRNATADDLRTLLALESTFPGDRLSARQYRHHLGNPRARLRVVVADGRVAGSSLVLTRAGSRRARLYSIVVDPVCRGRGLGRVLAEDALAQARDAGCDRLDLEVRADNPSALALYRALGFREQRRLPGYYADGMDGVRLGRAVAAGDVP